MRAQTLAEFLSDRKRQKSNGGGEGDCQKMEEAVEGMIFCWWEGARNGRISEVQNNDTESYKRRRWWVHELLSESQKSKTMIQSLTNATYGGGWAYFSLQNCTHILQTFVFILDHISKEF